MEILFTIIIVLFIVSVIRHVSNNKRTSSKHNHVQRSDFQSQQFEIREKQFYETLQLITSTKNPDTFFSRIDFAYEIAVEQQRSDWVIFIDNNLDKYISDFITRSCKHELTKIQKLKTDTNKETKYSAYCYMMRAHFEEYSQYAEAHTEQLESELSVLHDKLYVQASPVAATTTGLNVRLSQRSSYSQNVSPHVFETFKKAVFLNWASHGYEINSDESFYPQYMKYDLEITSPRLYHESLVREGMLCECNTNEKLARYKTAELKTLLQKYGLPIKRTKQEMIKTALQLDEDILIEETANLKRLKLTPNGEAFLDMNDGFVQYYRYKYGFSLAEYAKLHESGITNFDEAAEIILLREDETPNYCSKLRLAQLYYRIQKYELSLDYYIQTLYYGCEDKYGSGVVFAPAIIKSIHSLGEYYNDEIVDHCVACNPKVKSVYPKKEFRKIVNNIVSDGKP